jgi:Uncharacterized protein conserved in bacteria
MKSFKRTILLRPLATALAALMLSPFGVAQTPPVSGTYPFSASTSFNVPGRQAMATTPFTTTWTIDDDVTVTVSNANGGTANGAVFNIEGTTSNNLVFTIEPSGSTGRAIFRNNITGGEGGVFYQTRASLDLTNVSFIGNGSTKATGHGGGAIRFGSTVLSGKFTNLLFDSNFALSTGGAMRTLHGVEITSSTFTNNYAAGTTSTTGFGGAIGASSGGLTVANNGIQQSVVTNSYFGGNWASRYGGAIGVEMHHSLNFFDHVGFSDNFAGIGGGAFYDVANTGLLIGGAALIDGQRFVYTGTSGVSDYVYSGNVARGVQMTAQEIADARLGNGSFDFKAGAEAKAGGFYFADAENTRLRFDIAEGVTVSIGEAGNPSAWDSIANSDASGTTARIDLIETGETAAPGGTLILHADNSYFQGAVNVSKGALILGNQNAKLGGAITVADGRTFGGAGELITHKQDGSVFAGRSSLTVGNNARIQVGTDTASTGETLAVAGNVSVGSGVVFSHDLFSDGSASKLSADNISVGGPATINLGLLASGSFTLMEWTGTGLESAFSNLSLTIDGAQNNPRATAALSLDGKSLVATATVNNLIMNWTGAEGSVWTRRTSSAQQNWADVGGTGQTKYYNGDSVVFDGVADAANPGNRVITIDAGGVTLSGMTVTGTERYEFRGTGGIEVDAAAIGNATFTPTGKLTKTGTGELVFANTGANAFEGGIDLAGGTITFDRASQLGAGTAGIVFSDSATLRATSDVSGTLAESITVAAGKNAELRVDQDGELNYAGTLASGGEGATLRKTGDGALLLTGDNSANTLAVAVHGGSITLAETSAVLGGTITVNSDATLGGVGTAGTNGSVKVAAGGILNVGLDTDQAATLTVNNLELTGGAVIKLDLYKTPDGAYQQSDRIMGTGTSAISGSNIIDLTSYAAGTFNLGNLTDLAAATEVTLSGMTLPANGRLSAELSNAGGVLELVMTSDQSRIMTWTGGANSTWNLSAENWTDNGAVNQFSYGDRVFFDGTSAAGNRNVVVDAREVRVADMTVGGDADYTFTGGGIHASAENVQTDDGGNLPFTDATGKLTKTGSGVLTFANTKNTFVGGVDLEGGVIAIGHGDQLITSDSTGLTFTGDAAVRATADLTLADDIAIDAEKTGTIDSNGHVVTLQGTLTGGADTTFAKNGAGVVVLESDITGFAGTLAARGGTLRVSAADQLTNGGQAAIVVDAGATLDLDGHDQSLVNLSGAGTVALGSAALVYTADSDETFAGSFTGSGAVTKDGAGKWTLSGNSSHTGGVILQAGELGVASNTALGTGVLAVGGASGKVAIEADGLNIANDIAGGSSTLTLASAGHSAEFSGDISGSTVVLEGTVSLALSGTNTISNLEINLPLAIARRAESIGGAAVSIGLGSTLEFRGVESGQVNGNLSGDRVLITSSTMALAGTNTLQTLDIASGSQVTAASLGALGGPTTNVSVRDGASLLVPLLNTPGGNLRVDGGALVFGAPPPLGSNVIYGTQGSLELAGTLEFANGGEIRLGGTLPTGIYTAAVAAGGIMGTPSYDSHQEGMFMVADVDGDTLRITAYNKALEPGKDIVVGYSAISATTRAVSTHLSEDFINPLTDGKTKDAGANPNSVWFRAIGSYQEYGDDREHLGFTDKTYAGIVGYDWISTNHLMMGGYVGQSVTDLETSNKATTEMELPYGGLYAAKRFGRFFVSADVSAGFGKADTERVEEFGNLTKGSYKLDTLSGNLEIGYMVPLFAGGGIRPSIGVNYMELSFHDYAETGKGAVRLDDLSSSLLQGVARIEATKNIKLPWGLPGVIGVNLAWRQSIDSERTSVWATLVDYPGARIQINGDEYDEDSVTTGLTVRMMLSRNTLFALAYDYDSVPFSDQNSGTGRHTFNSVIRMSW